MPMSNDQIMQFMKMIGMGSGIGQAAGGAWNIFGNKGINPADAANQSLNKIPGQSLEQYNPYMQAGKSALDDLQNRYKDLFSGNVQNTLGENYKESPGYQWKLKQALAASNNAQAAGGMLGTPQHEQLNMQTAEGIAGQDYNDYIKNQMGLYGLGLGGEEGINNQGFDATKQYTDTLNNMASQQAGYNYAGQAGKNASKGQGMSDIFSGISSFLPFLFL